MYSLVAPPAILTRRPRSAPSQRGTARRRREPTRAGRHRWICCGAGARRGCGSACAPRWPLSPPPTTRGAPARPLPARPAARMLSLHGAVGALELRRPRRRGRAAPRRVGGGRGTLGPAPARAGRARRPRTPGSRRRSRLPRSRRRRRCSPRSTRAPRPRRTSRLLRRAPTSSPSRGTAAARPPSERCMARRRIGIDTFLVRERGPGRKTDVLKVLVRVCLIVRALHTRC